MPIQWLDVILILVMLLSAFLAMRKGITFEIRWLASWALAALVALFFYQLYRERVRALIGPQLLADAVLIAVVFITVLILLGLIPLPIPNNAVDRTLGFVYGLVRGLILVVIAYEVAAALTPKEEMPRWVTEARSLPVIERTGRAMLSLLPDNPASIFQSSEGSGISPYERQAALGHQEDALSHFSAGEARCDISNS